MIERVIGTVKWFNADKGFGFIQASAHGTDRAEDVFVHYRQIRGEGSPRLLEGQQVEFGMVRTQKGFTAEDVAVLN
ncbi:MAG: cold-shock protein [Chromatiales bacterium]|nr:cold-shock protein [Chromatiales bacterium]